MLDSSANLGKANISVILPSCCCGMVLIALIIFLLFHVGEEIFFKKNTRVCVDKASFSGENTK